MNDLLRRVLKKLLLLLIEILQEKYVTEDSIKGVRKLINKTKKDLGRLDELLVDGGIILKIENLLDDGNLERVKKGEDYQEIRL